MDEAEFEAADLMGRRVFGLFVVMIAIMGVLISIIPGGGPMGVVMCIAALILILVASRRNR